MLSKQMQNQQRKIFLCEIVLEETRQNLYQVNELDMEKADQCSFVEKFFGCLYIKINKNIIWR